MSGYDYANARLHARRAQLLDDPTLARLAACRSQRQLAAELSATPYRVALEAALVQTPGLEGVMRGLQADFVATAVAVRGFFTGHPALLVDWLLAEYDIHNLKTIWRGLTNQAPADAILAGTLPIGRLSLADLTTLAAQSSPRDALDVLATWRSPYARPLLAARARRPGQTLLALEMALMQWYLDEATAVTRREDRAMVAALQIRADVDNILTALRLAAAPNAANLLPQHFPDQERAHLFLRGGSISVAALVAVSGADSVRTAVAGLSDTHYGAALQSALPAYAAGGRLSDLEKGLEAYQLAQARAWFIRDPFGIGVFIGYLALKRAEARALRRIAQGIALGEPAGQIRQAVGIGP